MTAKPPPRPHLWKPGQSGNPSGRPAIVKDIQALARQHTDAAIKALVAALDDPRSAVAAASALLDRGYGKPPAKLEHTGADGGPIQTQAVTDDREDLAEIRARALAALETRH